MKDGFEELLGNLERQFLAQFGQPLKAIDLYVVARKHLADLQERFIYNHICHLKGDRAAKLEQKLHQAWLLEEEARPAIYEGYETQNKESAGRDAGDNGSNGQSGPAAVLDL